MRWFSQRVINLIVLSFFAIIFGLAIWEMTPGIIKIFAVILIVCSFIRKS